MSNLILNEKNSEDKAGEKRDSKEDQTQATIELQRLTSAFNKMKSESTEKSEIIYRSNEYKALLRHKRQMTRQQIAIPKKMKKCRNEKDARYRAK